MQLDDHAGVDRASFLLGYKSAFVECRCELASMAMRFAAEVEACRNELAELRAAIGAKFPTPPSTLLH